MDKSIFLKKHNILLIGFILRRCNQTAWRPKSKSPECQNIQKFTQLVKNKMKFKETIFFYKNKKSPPKEVLNSVFPGKQSP